MRHDPSGAIFARKYRQGILLVTLTESTRRLLDLLVKQLCGAEGAHIKTSTMNSIATDAIEALSADGLRSFTMARTQIDNAHQAAFRAVRDHPSFRETVLSKLPENKFEDFITDEVAFVRMRFSPRGVREISNCASTRGRSPTTREGAFGYSSGRRSVGSTVGEALR